MAINISHSVIEKQLNMKYNNVSVFQVITKVMADLDISEEQQRVNDYIEWACEAVELIGAPVQMETISMLDEDAITVKGYQAQLPSNIMGVLSVEYSDVRAGAYKKIFPSSSIKDIVALRNCQEIMYSIKPGYANLNIKDGFIKLTYAQLYKDQNGIPMIPDLMSYMEAIYWYIVMKLTYPMWRIGKIRDAVYYDAKKSWHFMKNKAYGEMMMPTLDEYMHNIKNVYNKLVPDTTAEYSDLSYIDKQQKVRL